MSIAIGTTHPPPPSPKPWMVDSDSAESGCFSPLVFMGSLPSTHLILGSSESWFGGGSDPMVVSRTESWAKEDGSGFWQFSFPQLRIYRRSHSLLIVTETLTSGCSPREAAPPTRYLTTWLFAQAMISYSGGHVINGNLTTGFFYFFITNYVYSLIRRGCVSYVYI